MCRNQMFLFQIGAIKTSTVRAKAQKPKKTFLFQIGAIKTIPYRDVPILSSRFLFQIGAIKTKQHLLKITTSKVSIPDWCD